MSSNSAPPPVVDDAAAQSAEESAVSPSAVDAGADAAQQVELPGGRPTFEPIDVDPGTLELARAAAIEESGVAAHVGDLLSAVAEDDVAISVLFGARQPGYVGWHWSVTLAVLGSDPATVSEVVLLPGEGSLLAPMWIPWDQRIRPGDVGVGDLLPPMENDPRLVPAYLQSDDPAVEAVAHELGVGRVHVLSRGGREEFAERLHDSIFGPTGEVALASPAHCFSCAFYLPLAGSLGQLVGACGNEYSPADGRVVDAEFGCGAHSETVLEMPARSAATLAVIDELSLEVHRRPEYAGVDEAAVPVDDVPSAEPAGSEITEPHDPELGVDQPDMAEVGSVDRPDSDLDIPELLDVGTDLETPEVGIHDVHIPDIDAVEVGTADSDPDPEVASVNTDAQAAGAGSTSTD